MPRNFKYSRFTIHWHYPSVFKYKNVFLATRLCTLVVRALHALALVCSKHGCIFCKFCWNCMSINRTFSTSCSYASTCRAFRLLASSLGPGKHGTGIARKLAVVSKAHALELRRYSTRKNFHREVLRRNEVFVLTYVDRTIFLFSA